MAEDDVLTDTVGQDEAIEAVVEIEEGQPEGQTAEDKPEGESEGAKKETAKERRDRDKAYKERLRTEAQESEERAAKAEAVRDKIRNAGASAKAPVEADFADYADYTAAKAVWTYRQQDNETKAGEADGEAKEARKRAEAIKSIEQQMQEASWNSQVTAAKARYADFDAVALSSDVPITPAMAGIIQGSDVAADVAYYLGKNRAIAADIAKLSPVEAARAIGRIEATMTTPKARIETKAPMPISPLKGDAKAAKNPAEMTMAEYTAARRAGKI